MKTNTKELNFKEGNPGAVQFGNFINYYKFHPPSIRINLLPNDIWNSNQAFFGLDLGCNAGDLTTALYQFLESKTKTCNILGVDIDPTLIQRANELNHSEHIQFDCLDFMGKSETNYIEKYLQTHSLHRFSAVFCFSITMWIHLNHGDDGLKRFLREISQIAELVIIEPQPWKCYKSAVKRMKLSCSEFPCYKQLEMRENVEEMIEDYLVGDCKLAKIHESKRSDWNRKILIFKN